MINFLKKIPFIKRLGVKVKYGCEYYKDCDFFVRNYSNSKEEINKIGYNILLITHSLEKGMASEKPRVFGKKKIVDLLQLLNSYVEKGGNVDDYPFVTGVNAVRSYVSYFNHMNWNLEKSNEIYNFLNKFKEVEKIQVGSYVVEKQEIIPTVKYNDIISTRHSVRKFKNKRLSDSDILQAVDSALLTPTACNRQMVHINYVKDEKLSKKVISMCQGFSGFDVDSVNLFIITFDVNANYFVGERNQGWLNVGLVSMNFVNALHSIGIGSCFNQFGSTFKEEEEIKELLQIPKNERIGVLISTGYYEDEVTVLHSPRKKASDIYRVIG
ncbi:TPA: nitroreductase family protein [Streptococcus suis]|nr:nitroreductase family protein [Streptococcus suis]